jgi:predicted Zn-dependent protease
MAAIDNEKRKGFRRFDDIRASIDQVLTASVADETEVVWLERLRSEVRSSDAEPAPLESPRLSVIVRVVEGSRQGWFRTDTADANLLEGGVRQALALAKGQPKLKRRPILPKTCDEIRASRDLLDREISRLQPPAVHLRLRELCGDGEVARLGWSEARLVIHNSHGMRRSAALSEATLEVRSGLGPGAGYAAASARCLQDLPPELIRDRARASRAKSPPVPFAGGELPILLAPEATIEWLNLLNAHAFSGHSFLEGTSFLSHHRNIQVFDQAVNLRDDGNAVGLPFPFDFEGSPKRPLNLIVKGKPSTPALNQAQGALTGLAPTAQSVGGQDAFFSNLFFLPGKASEQELLTAAEGGLRIGWLERCECFEPLKLEVRAIARGVRRIEGGVLGPVLDDMIWEISLLRGLARLRMVGAETVVRSMPTTPLGGISAPALVLEEVGGLRPISSR